MASPRLIFAVGESLFGCALLLGGFWLAAIQFSNPEWGVLLGIGAMFSIFGLKNYLYASDNPDEGAVMSHPDRTGDPNFDNAEVRDPDLGDLGNDL